MDDLYWSSLPSSLMGYDWCKLLKCYLLPVRDHCTVTWVLHPGGGARYYFRFVVK